MAARGRIIAIALAGALAAGACRGDPQAGGSDELKLRRAFADLSFDSPLFLAHAPGAGEHLFVVTQGGRIHVFENRESVAEAPVFLDLSAKVRSGGEEGLLGLAFDPAYADSGRFYVYYTARSDPRRSVLSRFEVPAGTNAADPNSEQILLEIPQPYRNHNGGMLSFGPDGKLYVAVGDGGSSGDPQDNGQRLDTVLGKILRLNPDGSIPADNPFTQTAGARGEIWAYGLRNPWRFSFDRANGTLWTGDVGQNEFEEVDIIAKGGNYGWRFFEGNADYNNPGDRPATDFEAPVAVYDHALGCSITGGYVYRGARLPKFRGQYFYADFCSGRLWALAWDGAKVVSNRQVGTVPNPSSFGEDAAGELYITSFDGKIYTLDRP